MDIPPEFWSILLKVVLWILAITLVLVGFVGSFLPALPGAPVVFAGLLIGAWIDGFQKVGWVTLVVLGFLALISSGIDALSTSLGAKSLGASTEAIAGAVLGFLVGIFFGLPGLILGPFLGAFIGELLHRRDWIQAGKVGVGTWLGLVVGGAAKAAILLTMIGLFLTAYLF
jgi:uncharacterized protein YqgC (DUF456 family)